jgi:hypothetical protein
MRLEVEWGAQGKLKASGDGRFLYRAMSDKWGDPVMRAPPCVESWGGAHCGSRAARAQGRWVWAGDGAGAPLRRVPIQTGESGIDGWAPLQSQAAWATDIWALATVPGFEFPKPVNFM